MATHGGGELSIYTRVRGLWTGYGLTPTPVLTPDWRDDATRHLAALTVAQRSHPEARWAIVHQGAIVSDVGTWMLDCAATEEQIVIEALCAGRRRERPRRIYPGRALG